MEELVPDNGLLELRRLCRNSSLHSANAHPSRVSSFGLLVGLVRMRVAGVHCEHLGQTGRWKKWLSSASLLANGSFVV